MRSFMVYEAACLLKKAGFKSNLSPHYRGPQPTPVVTFYHENRFPDADVMEMMERRSKNVVNLH
jgi:hypothetical protein